jgi:DNA (cytosine-5)-methyltransferase 1
MKPTASRSDDGRCWVLGALGLLIGLTPAHLWGSSATGKRVLELFAGAGGVALGLHQAGWRHDALVEFDPAAAATLRAAIRMGRLTGTVIPRDVNSLSYSGWRGVDLVWSSFPCSPWSSAGMHLGAHDPRNGWPVTFRAIRETDPTWFVGENVTGIMKHRKGCTGRNAPESCAGCYLERRIIPDLESRFAHVHVWELDAADFGVPQTRKRLFLVGSPHPVPAPRPLPVERTMLQALEYDPWERYDRVLTLRDQSTRTDIPGYGRQSEIRKELGAACFADIEDEYEVVDYYCTVCGSYLSDGACRCPGPLDSETRLSRPAPTLVGGSQKSHVSGRSIVSASAQTREQVLGALGRSGLSFRDVVLLSGFPLDWPFRGTVQQKLRQVANSIPPALAQAVGEVILEADAEARRDR